MVNAVFNSSCNTYGYQRITNELNEQQESCGKHRVISLMRKLDLHAKARRKFKATTNSQHDYQYMKINSLVNLNL